MKKCRLKIIRANILEDNLDYPQISYVSQSKSVNVKMDLMSNQKPDINEYITPLGNSEEIIIIPKENNSVNIKLQDIINSERNKSKTENNGEANNAVENDNINEHDEIKFLTDLKSSYPYAIINKKKDLNNSLKYIFKERLTRAKNNSKKKSNLSLPKLRTTNLFHSKNKNSYSLPKLSKSLSHSFNHKTMKFQNKKSKPIKNNISTNIGESNSSSFWKILDKNDFNYVQNTDYKALIDDLIVKECDLVKQKEEFIQLYEEKIKSLREVNNKLITEKSFVLDREDELNGELILLRNQYQNLFRNFKTKFIQNDDKFNKNIKEIDENLKKINSELKNGELILITRPYHIIKLSKEEKKYITYLLRGLFFSIHIFDTDKIVDLIWKFDKKFQTIYFLVEELLNLFNLDIKENQNILINYIYSFCNMFNYMNISLFKSIFKKRIGKIKLYNKYIQMSKLIHFRKRETKSLLHLIHKKDINSTGIINFIQFKQLFYNIAFANNITKEEQDETMEFIIYCMKKDCSLKLNKNKNNENKKQKQFLYDLLYFNLNDFIDEYNSKRVSTPYKLIRNYMEKHNIVSAEKLLRPILIPSNIIKKDSKEYIDEIILNKYLRRLGIIKKDEFILFNTFEEELVDIKELIDDIYTKELIDKNMLFEENREKVNNMIEDIFHTVLDKKL